jgi:hypothetical protein
MIINIISIVEQGVEPNMGTAAIVTLLASQETVPRTGVVTTAATHLTCQSFVISHVG